jgi:hypothetical protein
MWNKFFTQIYHAVKQRQSSGNENFMLSKIKNFFIKLNKCDFNPAANVAYELN